MQVRIVFFDGYGMKTRKGFLCICLNIHLMDIEKGPVPVVGY